MALDQFKTQVLLLHSEQDILDSLSSGFGDRYTVHCATSGVEALTTLGETPINVIISAQKLPGMSGVEALREAKKRSPETIGILLASKDDQGNEAIVGEKEVFQVVHGDVTSEGLRKLVDNATQQVRLMALAESANDTAANMDEPAEHIIMETLENGSNIISDGTGRFPALRPDKIAAETAAGSRSVDVLVLTKDQEFLATIRESSRGMHNVHYANTLKQADEAIREHKVGVAVVDAAMVGDKVEQLTLHLRKASPRLVAIVAGRRDDGEMLMDLINRGKVYRFLLKPVSPGRARLAVEASIKHHLEAPDSAFKPGGASAPQPQPAAKPATEQKPPPSAKPTKPPATKPNAAPKPKAAPSPAAKPPPQAAAEPAASRVPERVDPPLGEPTQTSPTDDRLTEAFDGDDGGLTATMTGFFSAVAKRFAGDKDARAGEPASGKPAATDSAGGSRLGRPLMLGIGAIVVVAVAGTLFWMLGGDVTEQEPVEPAASVSPSGSEADSTFQIPAEDTVDRQALLDEALAEVEAALLESRLDEAAATLQRVAELDPDNARLPFLTAQLEQVQLRTYIADARNAIRDTRFEDASNLIASARALGLSDEAQIQVVADELDAARSEQRDIETLALAAARLEEGDLLAPVNDNARYYYELVLANAPNNTAARQGLDAIANKLVLQARAEIDNGNLDAAEALLEDASAINAASSDLAATTTALQSARAAVAERERLAAEARRREEAERQAAAEREEAERRAAAEADAEEEAARPAAVGDAAAGESAGASASGAVADDAGAGPDPSAAVEADGQAMASAPGDDSAASSAGDGSMAGSASEPSQQATTVDDRRVSISSLQRTRYVAPKYPRAAERRGDSGWVDVVFTVAHDGTVKDIGILGSSPEGVFDRAAVRAVEKWEFEPVVEDGRPVEKRAGVRMMFALE